MMTAQAGATTAARVRALRWLLVGVVALLALAEVLAIYVILPGRAPSTFTALQPDSVSYVCQGLQLSWLDQDQSHELSGTVFSVFGYPVDSCSNLDPVMPWQVIARPLLPALIAVSAGILHTSWSILLPSIGIFAIFTFIWLTIVVPRTRRLRLRDWLVALAPFAAITMILWPAGVLTEGPVVVLSLLCVSLLATRPGQPPQPGEPAQASSRMSASIILGALAVAGLGLLLTRQSWPIVGAIWTAALLQQAWRRWPGDRARAAFLTIASAALGFALAIACARFFEALLVPTGLKERQKYVPEGLVLQDVPAMVWSSITSTANDIAIAVTRGDVISPVVLVAGLIALVLLVRRRHWAVAWVCGAAWALGFYAVGLVQVFDDASRTHLRFLVPATFMSIGALVLTQRRDQESA